ncbi:ABC transporter permease subunit [Aerococcaceae bacterium DSM 111020]|nr:ABC transporter permease subunit [Aerococcaceae bacterium DSM 111020]
MNKFRLSRLMSLFIIVMTLLTILIPSASAQDWGQEEQEQIEQGLETPGVFRVGMEANYAPFNWSQTSNTDGAVPISNSNGEYANGYDAQIAQQIADQLGLELEIVKLEWDGLPPALQSGKIDAIIAGMSPTPERLEQIDFSDSYYESDIVLVTRADSQYADATSLDDFENARVTGQLNTFHYELIQQIPGVIQQTAMDSFPTMISSVLSDKSDAYVSERPGAMAAVAANNDLSYVTFEGENSFDTDAVDTNIAVGLRKNSPLTPFINQTLSNISSDERDQLMQDMVDLNQQSEDTGFWGDVAAIWSDYGQQFIRGAVNTMFIALTSTIIGFLIGLIIAIFRSLPVNRNSGLLQYGLYKIFDLLITAYIEIFRGTPMMVQSMLIFYGSKLFFDIDMSSMVAALIIVSINTAAYLTEVIRGGIQGLDSGQLEATKAIGMNHVQAMRYVILPQAIRNILPALGNEFVINIKDTSVLNVIAVTELFFVTRSAAGSTYMTFQTFFIAALIYFVLTFATTRFLRYIETRMDGNANYTVHQSSTIPEN